MDELSKDRLSKEYSVKVGFFVVRGVVTKVPMDATSSILLTLTDNGKLESYERVVKAAVTMSPEVARKLQDAKVGNIASVKCRLESYTKGDGGELAWLRDCVLP